MLSIVVAAAFAGPIFANPMPWALGFAPAGRFPMVGDINGDGFADLICVSPAGDSFIDVALNAQGIKSLLPIRANSEWGKDCQAVCSGEFDETPGFDVAGLFSGDTIRLAHAFKDGHFADEPEWVKLPTKLKKPRLGWTDGFLYAWDDPSGKAFRISNKKEVTQVKLPRNLTRLDRVVARNGKATLLTFEDGRVAMADSPEAKADNMLGRINKQTTPAVANAWIMLDKAEPKAPTFVVSRPTNPYPAAPDVWSAGDIDNDGDEDLVQFRFGSEPHTGNNVIIHRRVSTGETDNDHDGIPNDEETRLGTDPLNSDTDNDGLLDGWEIGEFRGLDMKALGCDPKRPDAICLISRFPDANKDMVEATFKRIGGYYESIGWGVHPIFLDEMDEKGRSAPWWENRDRFIPAKWRGIVHYMQVSTAGGGQADQLGDGGGCGGHDWTLYATFIHEFGHQLGLSHEGFYGAAWCPTYSSMMNYAYSYGYEGDIKKIRYSDGSLKDFVMKESSLDELLPLPYEKVKFLEKPPYSYRLKENGKTTAIDWNWNGVFGEHNVRADINYSYSTTAGRRDEAGKTQSAPWTFTHNNRGYVLFAQHGAKADVKTDPTVSREKPGWLMIRRLIEPFKWEEPIKIAEEGVTGDPVAISYKGEIVVAYPSVKGLAVRWIKTDGKTVSRNELALVDETHSVPYLAIYKGRLFLLEWAPNEGYVRYRSLESGHKFSEWAVLLTPGAYPTSVVSKNPASMTVDTFKNEVIIGTAEDQDANRPRRWAIRRYKVVKDQLVAAATANDPNANREWIEGEAGGSRGTSRSIVLFDAEGRTGMKGRILYFGLGMTSEKAPWSCAYVAQSIADKTVRGGWMVKRYYDEWTQSRSGPAACWFNGDILYAYRWVDGSQNDRDNILHVSYNGTGIEDTPMGDFDDIGYIKGFGMRHSILYLRQ